MPPKTDRVAARRRQILDAAYRVFAAKGYQQTSIADIAAELGIGHGTFYRYFENKLDIFAHVIDEVVMRIGAVVLAEAPDATSDLAGYRTQLERLGRALYGLFMNDPDLARLLFYEAFGIDEDIDAKVRAAMEVFGGYTEQYLKNGIAKGFLRSDLDTEVTARAINAMIFEGARRVIKAKAPEQEVDRWIDGVSKLMLDGMGRP